MTDSVGARGARQLAAIDDAAVQRDGLKREPVAGDLDEHEGPVFGEGCGRHRRWRHAAPPQLPAGSFDEVGDALLRLDALVEVLVPGEDDVHAVADQQRLDHRAQLQGGAVSIAVGVERMMEVDDLPRLVCRLQRRFDPAELGAVHEVRVEDHEADRAFDEGVVALAAHVEERVVAVGRLVMVAERGVERHAGLQQRRVGLLELVHEVRGCLTAVQVVADHDHELERKPCPCVGEPRADFVLRRLAGAVVADDGEPNDLVGTRVQPRRRGPCRD